MVAWILSLMLALEPSAPWLASYEATAFAVADAARTHPLYSGELAEERTAALLVSLAFFESRFDPDATGDGGRAVGLFQVHTTHAPRAELLDPARSAEHAVRLMAESARICRDRPAAERLVWYTAGGDGCRVTERSARLSRHRVELGARLVREHPPG